MKWIHSWESVFGKMDGKGGGVVVSDATAANGLFGTAGTKWEVLNHRCVAQRRKLWNKKFHSFPRRFDQAWPGRVGSFSFALRDKLGSV